MLRWWSLRRLFQKFWDYLKSKKNKIGIDLRIIETKRDIKELRWNFKVNYAERPVKFIGIDKIQSTIILRTTEETAIKLNENWAECYTDWWKHILLRRRLSCS